MTSPASEPIIVNPRIWSSRTDEDLHETLLLVRRFGTQYSAHRQPRDTHGYPLHSCFTLTQSDARQRRIGEHAIRHQAVTRAAIAAGEVVANDAKIIHGRMRELRTSGALTDRPNCRRCCLQPLVDANVAAAVEIDPCHIEADPVSVRNASRGDKDVAAFDGLLAGSRPHRHCDLFAGTATHLEDLGPRDEAECLQSRG